MRKDILKSRILAIASKNPLGFTYNPLTGRLANVGYVVASGNTQDCVGKVGLFKVIKYCLRHSEYCIGGWMNEDGEMQFDASRVYESLEEAVTAAVENGQRAFFNLYTGKEIMASEYGMYIVAA